MKEIAIRRVVGANLRQIAVLLNRKYFIITLGGILIGSAGGYFLAQSVLDSVFAVHVGVEIWVLIVASTSVLAIVLVTIGLKMLGINHMNPSKILRAE
jgi:putative ABC transport system permease protein